MSTVTTQEYFLQRLSQTMPVLCRKIEKLNGENPAGTPLPRDRQAERDALVVRKDVLDYLEEVAWCMGLSPLEVALVDEAFYEDLWSLYVKRRHARASSAGLVYEAISHLDAGAKERLASIRVLTDESLYTAVTAFEDLVAKASGEVQLVEEAFEEPLSILDKFDAVVITNESRITGEELEYCTAQQALYVSMLAQHRYAYKSLQELKTSCDAFLQSVKEDNEYKSDGYTGTHYMCDYVKLKKEEFAHKRIGKIHSRFISIIIGYFTQKYGVDIESPEFEVLLGIEEPKEPSGRYRSFSRRNEWTDEELAEMKAEDRAFKKATEAYLDSIINAQLDYNTLLDHIFVQLDGSTFAERAEHEIKQGSRDASHNDTKLKYEIKNKKISFSILYPHKSWDGSYEVSMHRGGYVAILRALTYYDSGKREVDVYSGWHSFMGYTKYEKDGIFSTHDVYGNRIEAFRYYKNGKFEVTFSSHTNAKQFASEYLYVAEGGGDG